MRTFLFEQYGYYPKEITDNVFFIDGWKFKLIECDFSSDNLTAIENYTKMINETFFNRGPYIIKNKLGSNISVLNDINYVLISSLYVNMNLNELMSFHSLFYKNDEYVELDKILNVWKERVDEIEQKISLNLRVDSIHYKNNLDICMFCIGLAINAMQYLSDIIYNYDNKMYGVTIVHKRLKNLNSFDMLNPFNFIVEHPLKDLVMLYQSDYLSFEELKDLLDKYQFDIISATFFIARMLYRVDIFDFIETKRDLEEGNQKIDFNIKKEIYKIKKAYSLLKDRFSIRPIDWLEEIL